MLHLAPLLAALASTPADAPTNLADLLESGKATRLGTPARFLPGPVSGLAFTDVGLVAGADGADALVVLDPTGEAPDRRLTLDPAVTTPILLTATHATLMGPDAVVRQLTLADGEQAHAWPKGELVHTHLALSADGRVAVATNLFEEHLLRFDLVGHETLEPVPIGDHWTRVLALSPDASVAALYDLDGRLRVLDLTTGEALLDAADQPEVTGMAFRPDGELLLIGGPDTISMIDTETWQPVDGISGWGQSVLVPAFSPDGRISYFGTEYGQVYGLDVAAGELEFWSQHGDLSVTALALSTDGAMLAAGDDEGRLRVYASATGEELLGPTDAHGNLVWSLVWGAAGPLSLSSNGTLAHWELEAGGATIRAIEGMTGEVVDFRDGAALVGGDGGPLLKVAAGEEPELVADGEWYAACFGITDEHVVVGDWEGRLQALDLQSGELAVDLTFPGGLSIFELTPVSGTSLVACGLEEGSIAVADLAKGEFVSLVASPRPPEPEVESGDEEAALGAALDALGYGEESDAFCVGLVDAGSGRVLLGLSDGAAGLIDPLGEAEPRWLELEVEAVQDVAAHTGSGRLAVAHDTGVTLFDAAGDPQRTITSEVHIATLAFSPDGKQLALGAHDGTLVVVTLE